MRTDPPIEIERTDHPSKFVWPAWALRELGKMPDVVLARHLKIHPGTVANERLRRDIPPATYRAPVEWTDEMIAQLGMQSDAGVARALGISLTTVGNKRRELEIGPSQPQVRRQRASSPFWTAERDALLGTESDQKIADRLGLRRHQVSYRRNSLEIAPATPRKRIDWTGIDPLLGQQADQSIVEQFGINHESVRRRRSKLKIASFQAPRRTIVRTSAVRALLSNPTQEINEVSSSAVCILRQELKVAPPPRVSVWTPELLARLGNEPDEEIAADTGLSRHTVRLKRCQLQRWNREPRRRWSKEDEVLLLTIPDDHEAAKRLDRTVKAIKHKRLLLAKRKRS